MSLIRRDVFESDLPFFYEQPLDPEATAMADFPSRARDFFMAHCAKIKVSLIDNPRSKIKQLPRLILSSPNRILAVTPIRNELLRFKGIIFITENRSCNFCRPAAWVGFVLP
ncbi:MAG TPA: hypothetical protein VKE92_06285, partial [Anaerolineales bacterium]|nr:hypothetical protein [Anaerolineales bacterium]